MTRKLSVTIVAITVILMGLIVGVVTRDKSAVAASGRIQWAPQAQFVQQDGYVIIDHQAVDASVIPLAWLDQARQLDTFFAHMSVGNNILDGMVDLEIQDATRYAIAVEYGDASWFATHGGILHRTLGDNEYPLLKVDTFDDYIRQQGFGAAQLAMMKFCPSDVPPFSTTPATDTWTAYRTMMEGLVTDYPDVEFVWWTISLATVTDNRGNDERAIFNAAVRDYCATNGCVLFDIADIESHDPDGNPVVSATGHEAMWDGYSDDGAHLNEIGRVRVAQAYWWLLARMAGWGSTASLSVAATDDAVSVSIGGTAMYTLTVTAEGTLTQPVTLSLDGAPGGATTSFIPDSLTPPGMSHLVITTTLSVAPGTYPMTVTAAAGDISDTAFLTLTVIHPALDLAVHPLTVVTEVGETALYTLSVTGTPDFSMPVLLTLSDIPPMGIATFDPNPVIPPGDSYLSITTTAITPGVYPLLVTADAEVVTKTAALTLVVVSTTTPSFTLSVMPQTRTALPTETVAYTVSVTGTGGFESPVTLSALSLPEQVVTGWSHNPVSPGNISVLTCTVLSEPVFGEYPFMITGEAEGQVVVREATLIIAYPYQIHLPLILKEMSATFQESIGVP